VQRPQGEEGKNSGNRACTPLLSVEICFIPFRDVERKIASVYMSDLKWKDASSFAGYPSSLGLRFAHTSDLSIFLY